MNTAQRYASHQSRDVSMLKIAAHGRRRRHYDDDPIMDAIEVVVPLPDGRQLAGRSLGPAGGLPVLLIAGAATGRSMTFGADQLTAFGVRLLTMDRPGMGRSDHDPDRTVESTANDYRAFVTTVLGDTEARLPVVANSQGSVFGLQAAVSGWASRLVLVSPADEVAHPEIRAMLPREATQLPDLAKDDPHAAAEKLSGFNASHMEAMVLDGASEEDRRYYSEPEFLDMYRRALAEGFASSGSGYIRDTLIAMRPWNLQLDSIRCPVDILFGAKDSGHSPDGAETLSRRIPTAERQVIPDAGGALLWNHAATVIQRALGLEKQPA